MVSLVWLPACRSYYAGSNTAENIPTLSPGTEDGTIDAIITPYRDSLSQAMDQVVAVLATELVKEQPECNLGNHLAHAMLLTARSVSGRRVDFSVMNYGGIRVDAVAPGELRVRDAYQISPFENFIVVLELTGGQVRELLQRLARYGGWPVEGISYVIDDGSAVDIRVAGVPLKEGQTYSMATVDYIANGGDDISILQPIPHLNTGVLLRDAILAQWKITTQRGEQVSAVKDGRVRIK